MKLGLGSYAYRWSIGLKDKQPEVPLGPLGFMDKAVRHGVELVQFADNVPLQGCTLRELEAIARYAQSHALEIELGTEGIVNGHAQQYLELATTLNAKLVRATLNAQDLAQARAKLVKSLQQTVEAYASEGVTLALENYFLFPSVTLIDILQQVNHPHLGVCLDVANSIVSHEWPETTIQQLAPFAVNLHLKDYRFEVDPYGVGFQAVGVPLGEGEMDIQNVFDALVTAKVNSDLNVILEYWLPRAAIDQEGLQLEDVWTRQSVAAAQPYVEAFNQAHRVEA
ncbi:MAG: sugar phosphate isomerase/epimerase family protein [Deinococcota bacterium]